MKSIIVCDVLIVLSFLAYFGSMAATNYLVMNTEVSLEIAKQLEANPIARKAMDFKNGIIVMGFFAVAMMGGLYALIRMRYKKYPSPSNQQLVMFFSVMVFLYFLHFFVNDASLALKLLRG